MARGARPVRPNTDSFSQNFGFKENLTGSIGAGDIEKTGIQVTDTVKAFQDFKNTNEQMHGKFESRSDSVSSTTGWGDSITYSTSTVNIWVYEVIGKTVCPAETPACDDSERQPMTIQFSAPSQTLEVGPVVGSHIEWYQPPWEPGNIFSYPANEGQLQQIVGGVLDKLTQDRTYYTDSNSVTESTVWKEGVNANSTVGHVQTFGGSNSLSVAGRFQGLILNKGFSFSFKAYGSNAFSSLTQTNSSSNQTTGMSFIKPGTFATDSLYSYAFTPYIFGTKQPLGFADTVDLNTQLTTFGPLRSAFVVNPTQEGSGTWWSTAYPLPDVALNHPVRWSVNQAEIPTSGASIPSNCLPFGTDSSKMDCVERNQYEPSDPWDSAFHHMRGFFISGESQPGAGPQREIAEEGEHLRLQARVYNYSTTPMLEGAQVHVRFYGVPWGTNSAPAGPAFLIGEDVLDPVPAFDPSSNALNWVLANATWNTSGLANKQFTFFVVTWMQNADGSLGTEMPGHGLNSVPGILDSFIKAALLEETVADAGGGGAVSYSNNIGIYNAPLHVLPQQSSGDTAVVQQDAPGDVRLGQIKLSEHKPEQGQTVEVLALLRTQGKAVSGVSVTFYDGDPGKGGKVFDAERIPHIRARDAHLARVRFRPSACGEHRIFVTVGHGRAYKVTDSSRPVTVKCAEPPTCKTNCFRAPEYYSNNLWAGLPKGEVWIAGAAAPVNTRNVYALSQALKGGNSPLKSFNRQYVAMQLSMLAADLIGERRREVLNGKLSCYGLGFAAIGLSNGAQISSETTLQELMGQSEWAARAGRRADWEKLSVILDSLNSDDPSGACDANGR